MGFNPFKKKTEDFKLAKMDTDVEHEINHNKKKVTAFDDFDEEDEDEDEEETDDESFDEDAKENKSGNNLGRSKQNHRKKNSTEQKEEPKNPEITITDILNNHESRLRTIESTLYRLTSK